MRMEYRRQVGPFRPHPIPGNVLITNLELNAPDGDKATFSAAFEGTGKLTPRVSGDGGIVDDPTA